MNENQSKPEENLPGKEQEKIPGTQPISSSTIQPQQPMEVHHHGHVHEKAKWKEYIFQFIMLFLAVFLGFLAENLREKGVERHMETEYIESLVKDAVSDSFIAHNLASDIFTQVKGIDSLQTSLFDFTGLSGKAKDSVVKQCYLLSRYVQTFYPYFFNESTIMQLLSSGNMRLIKKTNVPDMIMEYHGYIKFVEVQKQFYVKSVTDCVQSMYDVFDISFLKSSMSDGNLYRPSIDSFVVNPTLIAKGTDEIRKFTAILETTKVIAATYRTYLLSTEQKAHELAEFLRATYHLKELEKE